MRSGSHTQKIPGGKMVRVDAQFAERIEWVKITGDFFLHPEETLDRIEACLLHAPLPLDTPGLTRCISECLQDNQAELIGAAPADFVAILAEAVK